MSHGTITINNHLNNHLHLYLLNSILVPILPSSIPSCVLCHLFDSDLTTISCP